MLISRIFKSFFIQIQSWLSPQLVFACELDALVSVWFDKNQEGFSFYKCMPHEFLFYLLPAYLKKLKHMNKGSSVLDLNIKKKQFLKWESEPQTYLFSKLEPTWKNLIHEIRKLSLLDVINVKISVGQTVKKLLISVHEHFFLSNGKLFIIYKYLHITMQTQAYYVMLLLSYYYCKSVILHFSYCKSVILHFS